MAEIMGLARSFAMAGPSSNASLSARRSAQGTPKPWKKKKNKNLNCYAAPLITLQAYS